jgi:oxygen-dependent protoporphyrinogen oxidase
MAGWARAHLGQTALDYLITPMTKGIYACAPDQLDQALAFPNLSVTSKKSLIGHLLRKRRQGVIAAEMAAPERGMASLIEKLVRAIENNSGAKIIYHSSVTELPQGNVILACDSKAAAQLLKSDKLAKITYNPMVTATIFYDEKHIRPVDGVGVLYSAHEKRRSLGILFNSSTFDRRATKGFSSFTMMLGGYGQEALLNENDQALHVIIENEMREVLGIAAKPLAIYLTRWPQAIPVYNAELKHILETMTLPTGLALTGNYTGEVSLRGMTDRWIAKTSRSFKV